MNKIGEILRKYKKVTLLAKITLVTGVILGFLILHLVQYDSGPLYNKEAIRNFCASQNSYNPFCWQGGIMENVTELLFVFVIASTIFIGSYTYIKILIGLYKKESLHKTLSLLLATVTTLALLWWALYSMMWGMFG